MLLHQVTDSGGIRSRKSAEEVVSQSAIIIILGEQFQVLSLPSCSYSYFTGHARLSFPCLEGWKWNKIDLFG